MSKIELVRGDSYCVRVGCVQGDTIIPFVNGDEVYLSVKGNINDTDVLLQKMVNTFGSDGKANINILPSDTKELAFDTYVYDIEFHQLATGMVKTIVRSDRFVVLPEVTDV